MIVDVELRERYWYPEDGGEVWVAGYHVVDATGAYIGRDDLPAGLGDEHLPEPGGQDVEVVQVDDRVVVEIALGKGAIGLAEVRGEDVEIEEVYPSVVIGVTGQVEEVQRDVVGGVVANRDATRAA